MPSINLQVNATGDHVNFYRKNPASAAFGTTPLNPSPVLVVNGIATYSDTTVLAGHIYDYVSTDLVNGMESAFSNEVISVAVPFPPVAGAPSMGAAAGFLVLGGSAVTNTGPTTVNGDVGVSPGSSITGFPPGLLSGTLHTGGPTDFVSAAAQTALALAFAAAKAARNPIGVGPVLPGSGPFIVTSVANGTSGTTLYTGTFLPGLGGGLVGQKFTIAGFTNAQNNGTFTCLQSTITTITLDNANGTAEVAPGTGASATGLASDGTDPSTLSADIGGQTLKPGVYSTAGALGITGRLVLDAHGDPQAVWIFNVGTALTMAGDIILANGAQASNVFWTVGSSATIGAGSSFAGTLMAKQSITLVTGATVNGRVLAQVGAVTMDTNTISLFISSQLSVWTPNTPFALGTVIFDCVSGTFQWVTTAGISGETRPIFNTGLGSTTQDNTVTWTDPPIGSFLAQGPLPPTPPNVPPAPPAPPTNLQIVSETGD